MTYSAIVDMARSHTLINRIAAAAASENVSSPYTWASERAWEFAAQPGWPDAWQYTKDTDTVNQNPDTGARNDCITDAMILSAVQAINVP